MLREEKSKAGINKMSGTKTEMRGFSADCASGSAPMTWSEPEIRGSAAHDLSRAASLDERLSSSGNAVLVSQAALKKQDGKRFAGE